MSTTLEKLEELISRKFEETGKRPRQRLEKPDKAFRQRMAESNDDFLLRKEEADKEFRLRKEEGDKEFRRRMKESDKRFKEEMKKLSEQISKVGDPIGRFAESVVYPAAIPLLKKRGLMINQLWGNMPTVKKGENMQLDIAGIGDDFALVIQVHMRLKREYIENFIQKKLSRVFGLFPLLQRPILCGGVAAMTVDQEVKRFAYKQGLFVLTQTGDNVRIMNDKAFRPRSFDSFQTNGKRKTRKR